MMRRLLFIVAALVGALVPSSLHAQKIRTEKGEYVYYPPETQSMELARQTAVERAKLQILADTFGTSVAQTATTRISDGTTSTTALSSSSVRGEWIETVSGPEIETMLSPDGMIAIRVRIAGRVREITAARTEIQAQVLRNGTEPRFASLEFKDGDDLFLRFKSPADGNLLVYLYDGDEDVYCLLPYSAQKFLPVFPVQAMQEYLFFSGEGDSDEYSLTCAGTQEINRLYVIFSPNRFTRAADRDGRRVELPRTLSWEAFQQYLSRARAADPEMIVEDYMLTINKN